MISYFSSSINPGKQISQRLFANLHPNLDPFRIVWVKEVVFRLVITIHLPPILAEVEDPGVDPKPLEISGELLADVRLAPGRQSHHGDDVRGGAGGAGHPRGPLGEGDVLRY